MKYNIKSLVSIMLVFLVALQVQAYKYTFYNKTDRDVDLNIEVGIRTMASVKVPAKGQATKEIWGLLCLVKLSISNNADDGLYLADNATQWQDLLDKIDKDNDQENVNVGATAKKLGTILCFDREIAITKFLGVYKFLAK